MGQRTAEGWLSNLHLGARDETSGQFVMLGKTFKGLTDEMLTWQTTQLLGLETHRDQYRYSGPSSSSRLRSTRSSAVRNIPAD